MKKIVNILLILTCVLGLTACGGQVETLKYDEAMIKSECEYLYNLISADYTEEEVATYHSLNDDQLANIADNVYQSLGIKGEGSVFIAGIDSWIASEELIGDCEPAKRFTFVPKKNELQVRYDLNGSIHNGSIDYTFDKNLHVTSITVNPKYSLSESMERASVNTLVGMGTVFIMLIIIMFIIMLLGAVCNIGKGKKKEDKKDSVDKAIDGIVAREEESSLTDDLELVAVISAAIAASEGASDTDGFVVRSIRRIK